MNITTTFSDQKKYLSDILDENDFNALVLLKEELQDTWIKKQIFRTETEMRVSVLNDIKHPTKASKYWQCVREQNAFFESIITLSFEYRKNEVKIKKIKRQLEEETDELEKELLQVELEEYLYARSNMQLIAKDRIREIKLWSKLKNELDDGSFDKVNVNSHQMQSLKITLENKAKAIPFGTSASEIANIVGPLQTILKTENKTLPNS